jgi:hypothetical protein
MRLVIFLLSLILLPTLTAAQSPPVADSDLPVPSWGRPILDSFNKPLHPVVGGVASGGGLGAGVGYDSPDDERWFKTAEAMVTIRGYWSLEGEIGRRSMNKRSQIALFGGVRHMNRVSYYGIGPDTLDDDRSGFRLRDNTFGTRGWYRAWPALRLGGSVAAYLPDHGPGGHRTVRSIEQVFPTSSIPGFDSAPNFGRYRGFAELIYPIISEPDAPQASNVYGATYQLSFESVRDHSSGRYNFHRWETEVQQRIPGVKAGQRLTLHGFVATTNEDADVPFYLLYTLGGSGGLKAFRPDLLGGDGTRATLRAFKNYRFRDRNLVLMQAEYRIPLHRKVDATVFVDAGQVAPRPSELFNDLRAGTGFSLSYMRKGKALGRMDVGFGGGEGVQLFWSFGAFEN